MTAEIVEFFESYCQAFNALDGEAVARLYATPSGIASDKGYAHWADRHAVQENMDALCDLYRKNGFKEARFVPKRFMDQGADFAVADLHWQVDRVDDLEPWKFDTTYNLMKTEDGWRVLLCTAYSEKRLTS